MAELTAHLKVALRQAEQLGGLIEALFELARLESGTVAIKVEPVSIAELLQDIGMRFRVLADAAHVRLSTQLDTSGVLVHADVALIERVISNLLENAIRHTPEHGEVRLEMSAQDSSVCVRVCDTGCGSTPNGCLVFSIGSSQHVCPLIASGRVWAFPSSSASLNCTLSK